MCKISSTVLVVLLAVALAGANTEVKIYRENIPFLVSLRVIVGESKPKHFCEATIISDNWLISAARCFYGDRLYALNVVAAASGPDLRGESKVFLLQRIINHPKFNEDSFDGLLEFDISLLQTSKPITFNSGVQAIPMSKSWIESGKPVETVAWGISEPGSSPFILKKEKMLTVPHDFCVESQKPSYKPLIHSSTVCTVSQHTVGTARFGAGAPLILNKQLVGIFSWGNGNKPDALTTSHNVRISEHTKWIKDTSGVEAV